MNFIISHIISLKQLVQVILGTAIYSCKVDWRIWQNWSLWQRLVQIDTRFYWSLYRAGIALGKEQNPHQELGWFKALKNPYPFSSSFWSYNAAKCLLAGVVASTGAGKNYALVWEKFAASIDAFLETLEQEGITVLTRKRDLPMIEQMILDKAWSKRPLTIGTTHAIPLELTLPFADLFLPSSIVRLHCMVEFSGEFLGTVELPVIDGMVSRLVLADAIAARFAWDILTRFFENSRYPHFRRMHQQAGWTIFLQELWGQKSGVESFSTEVLMEMTHQYRGTFQTETVEQRTVEVSEELTPLEVNASTVEVIVTVGGAAIGSFIMPMPNQKIEAEVLRAATILNSGFELCRAAVREGLIGKSKEDTRPLRLRLAQAAAVSGKTILSSSGSNNPQSNVVLGHKKPTTIGTSASRWAMLPTETMDVIKEAIALEPLSPNTPTTKSCQRIFVTPKPLLSQSLLPRSIRLQHNIRSIQNSKKTTVVTHTDRLPILMYHSVCPLNTSQPRRWQLTPEAFESQLHYLKNNGFHTVTLEDWRQAITTQIPLPGKAILLTFDDGYLDFYIHALPLLKRYGFSATVFIIAEKVGQKFERRDLMDWHHLKQLLLDGIEFGSHSAKHPSLLSLSHADIVREGLRARTVLEQKLGIPIQAFCYPFGDSNPIIRHLIGACGYELGLSLGLRRSGLNEDLLNLSRIEIEGTDSIKNFVSKLKL